MAKQRVLVTGVTGYVGSWCMHYALEAGFHVVGTCRDPESSKCDFIRQAMNGKAGKQSGSRHTSLSPKAAENLTLVKADLLDGDEAWSELVGREKVDFILHTASPYVLQEIKDEKALIEPAVNGTITILRAGLKHGVKRTVLTSSVVATWGDVSDGKVITDKDWSDPQVQTAYAKSKTLAEKAAWKCVEGTCMELVTILPGAIIGPTLYTDGAMASKFESGNFLLRLATGQTPIVPKVKLAFVDVRDVAKAHMAAMLATEGVVGQRFIMTPGVEWFVKEADVVRNSHPGLNFKTRVAPNFFLHIYGKLTGAPEYKSIKHLVGIDWSLDSSGYTDVLGCQWFEKADSFKDMVDDFVELGALKL